MPVPWLRRVVYYFFFAMQVVTKPLACGSPLVGWYGKTVNAGGSVTQLRDLLLRCHSVHQVYESTKISTWTSRQVKEQGTCNVCTIHVMSYIHCACTVHYRWNHVPCTRVLTSREVLLHITKKLTHRTFEKITPYVLYCSVSIFFVADQTYQ